MAYDVVTVGNLLIDLLVTVPDDNPYARVDSERHELCVKAGEKILAERVGFVLGGGAGRVAIGLRRLGLTSGIFADVGDDELSERIRKTLTDESVSLAFVNTVAKQTSFTVGLNFQQERTLFVHHIESPHHFDFSHVRATWVYLASLGSPWEHAYEAVVAYKNQTGAKIACNPGQSQFVKGRESYLPTLRHVDVLFLNKQEAQLVTGIKTDDMKRLLATLQEIGVGIAVITDGRNGSFAIGADGKSYQSPIVQSPVVERTGAGDAYAAGFLASFMAGKSVSDSMKAGTLNAAAVVTEFGGLTGLLTKEELEKSLEQHSEELVVQAL